MKKASKRTQLPQMTGKGTCQFYHAKKRARERMGFTLTDSRCELLIRYIKEGKSDDEIRVKFLNKQSNRVHMYSVNIRGFAEFNVLYDTDRHTIVTLLYPEEDKLISHYYDVFGNKISLRDTYGSSWKIKDDELYVPCEEVKKIGPKEWEVELNCIPKIFILQGDFLVEKSPW